MIQRGGTPLFVILAACASLSAALPACAQQAPTGEVAVPPPAQGTPGTGVYYTEMAPPAPCPQAHYPADVYYVPETYNNFDADLTLVERGTRGPYADPLLGPNPLFGSHKIWTPAGAWNDRQIALYPLPLVIQPHLCLYDGPEDTGCSKNCPEEGQGLQFSYPRYGLENSYRPNALPHPSCEQPPAFQDVMVFQPNLTVWAGAASGAEKGRYRLPYHDVCIHDAAQACTVKAEPAYSIRSWSDWAATFTLHADNNPPEHPGFYDVASTFAVGSPLVLLEFSDDLPHATMSFEQVPKMNAIPGAYAGQPFLQYPDQCTVSPNQHTATCGANAAQCTASTPGQFLLSGHLYDYAGESCLSGIEVWLHDNHGGLQDTKTTTDASGYYCFAVDRRAADCRQPGDQYTVIADRDHKSSHCFPQTWLVCPSGGGAEVVQDIYAGGQPEHAFAFILPEGATQAVGGNGVTVTFGTQPTGGKWVVAVLMPDVPSGSDRKAFWTDAFKAMLDGGGAYGVPRDSPAAGPGAGTRIDPWPPTYDGASRAVTTTFTFTPSVPSGLTPAKVAVLSGLFPHQWRTDRGNGNTADLMEVGGHELAYKTALGTLKLASAPLEQGRASFSTTMTFPGLLPELPKVSDALGLDTAIKAQFHDVTLRQALAYEIDHPWDRWASYPGVPPPVDPFKNNTYDTGKIMGQRAVLARVAKNLGAPDLFATATAGLRRDLESWLGGGYFPDAGAENKKRNFLYYDGAWGMLIGYPAAYYSEAHTTDLHFHYGYWIRSAAEIARQDKGWIPKWGPVVNLLAKTIANRERTAPSPPDPQNPAMPFLALFDPYSGHSWAKGMPDAKIDQESSSEALNAWAGIILWGQEWGQAQDPPDYALRDLGIWMYTTEMNSVYNYWFDAYEPHILPAEWGSRGTYQAPAEAGAAHPLNFKPIVNPHESALTTNFGMHPDFLSAINWLPFHGGSFYLSSDDPGLQANFQGQLDWAYWNQAILGADHGYEAKGCSASSTASCGTHIDAYCPKSGWSDGWAERMFMFQSMQGVSGTYNSDRALAEMVEAQTAPAGTPDTPPKVASAPDLGDSVSHTYYWLHNMGELGVRREGITADSPFAVVFERMDTPKHSMSFVAWNPGTEAGPYKDVTFKDSAGTVLWTIRGLGADEVRVEPSAHPALPGDADYDSGVSIGEVQQSVNMFLGIQPPGNGVDCSWDGVVSIGEVQKVINAFLGLPSVC